MYLEQRGTILNTIRNRIRYECAIKTSVSHDHIYERRAGLTIAVMILTYIEKRDIQIRMRQWYISLMRIQRSFKRHMALMKERRIILRHYWRTEIEKEVMSELGSEDPEMQAYVVSI